MVQESPYLGYVNDRAYYTDVVVVVVVVAVSCVDHEGAQDCIEYEHDVEQDSAVRPCVWVRSSPRAAEHEGE